jgi:hypothetical protein
MRGELTQGIVRPKNALKRTRLTARCVASSVCAGHVLVLGGVSPASRQVRPKDKRSASASSREGVWRNILDFLPDEDDPRNWLIYAVLYLLTFVGAWAFGLIALTGAVGVVIWYIAGFALMLFSPLFRHAVSFALWLFYCLSLPFVFIPVSGYLAYHTLPMVEPITELTAEEPQAPLFIHISDLHFIGEDEGKTYQGEPWSVVHIRAFVKRLMILRPVYVLGRVCKVYSTPNHRMVAAISHMAW